VFIAAFLYTEFGLMIILAQALNVLNSAQIFVIF